MKGTIVLLIFIMMASVVFAQNVTAYWTLTWDGNCSNTIGPVNGSAIKRANPAPVPTISYTSNGAGSNKWNVTALAANRYYQYKLTASANITINSLSLVAKVNQANMHGAIRYSLDGFTTHSTLVADYTFSNVNDHTFTNNAVNIPIASGQTLTIRVYAWNATTANKIFYNRNLIMYGNTRTISSDYFRTKANGNWDQTATWESSSDGATWYDATLTPTATANTVTINHAVTLTSPAACNNIAFAGGSINLGNYNLAINGSLAGIPYYTYSGIGVPSQSGTNAIVTVTTTNPTSLPPVVNAIDVNPGVGNNAELPNNVTTTLLTFTSGALAFSGHTLTLANNDFAITGTQTVANMAVALSNTIHTFAGNTSIAHMWQTSGTVSGEVILTLFYPVVLSNSPQMKVFQRSHIDGESNWTLVGIFSIANHGSTNSITVPGISALSDGRGDLDWTISETDQTLPVELASFTATFTHDCNITLNWITHSETDVLGYSIFRNTENILSTANCLTQGLIPATNTSDTHTYSYTDDEVGDEHVIYYYWLQYTEFSGQTILNGPVTIEVNDHGTPTVSPEITSLQAVFPNPFRNATTVRFGLKTSDRISIEVFNIKGQLVNKLISGNKVAGTFDIRWNGTDLNGSQCRSGVYYIVMNTSSTHTVRKIVKF